MLSHKKLPITTKWGLCPLKYFACLAMSAVLNPFTWQTVYCYMLQDTGINFTDQVISFTGDHLDIGVLKDSIEITIAQRTDNSSLNFTCEPTSFSLYSMECEVLEPKLLNASPKDIHVRGCPLMVYLWLCQSSEVIVVCLNCKDANVTIKYWWFTPPLLMYAAWTDHNNSMI